MKISLQWKEKLQFSGTDGTHEVAMDTKRPLGSDTALTPKQLVIAGLCGCTGMDVVSLLRKYKEPLEAFEIDADVPTTSGHPSVFEKVHLIFNLKGQITPEKALEAVRLSQTQYCGVSAMLSKAVPITYQVFINEIEVGSGEARF